MKVFLPCFNTFIDGLDIKSPNHISAISFFAKMVDERQKCPQYTRAFFPPSLQREIIDIIIEVINGEWKDLPDLEIQDRAKVINKILSAMDLEGEHLDEKMPVGIALFELALYLDDEHEVFIVTNDFEKLKKTKKEWIEFRKDKEPKERNFVVINPAQAIYLMMSSK